MEIKFDTPVEAVKISTKGEVHVQVLYRNRMMLFDDIITGSKVIALPKPDTSVYVRTKSNNEYEIEPADKPALKVEKEEPIELDVTSVNEKIIKDSANETVDMSLGDLTDTTSGLDIKDISDSSSAPKAPIKEETKPDEVLKKEEKKVEKKVPANVAKKVTKKKTEKKK